TPSLLPPSPFRWRESEKGSKVRMSDPIAVASGVAPDAIAGWPPRSAVVELEVAAEDLVDVLHDAAGAELLDAGDLDLADALAGQVQDVADLLEGHAALLADVEGAGVLHLPDLEVGEVELDRLRLVLDVE